MVEAGANTADPGKQEHPLAWLRINLAYYRSPQGCLKILQLLLGIICMACASPAILNGTHWFLFVAVMSFIATLIWFFVYLLSIREALTLPINWVLTEVVNTGIITVLYFTAFVVQLSIWSPGYETHYRAPNIAAGVFGLFNTLAYGAGTYLLYAEWKASSAPQ